MNIADLKPADQDGVIGRTLRAYNQATYIKKEVLPLWEQMQEWEIKEYRASLNDYKEEVKEYKELMISDEPFWNENLSRYNMSIAVFINKFMLPVINA